MTKLRRKDYHVVWICALTDPEWQASKFLLDEDHEDPDMPDDFSLSSTPYFCGEIDQVNLVIACLPETGTERAVVAGRELKAKFPEIHYGLLVGVGGGVWSKEHDVRLGDVVVGVSDEKLKKGGVVQYDSGTAHQGRDFQVTGSLKSPPAALLGVLAKVRLHEYKNTSFHGHLQSYERYRGYRPDFCQPPGTEDQLYQTDYCHENPKDADCSKCEQMQLVIRVPRPFGAKKPEVHYGTIASGKQVMSDAIARDKLAGKYHVLCFETEAAGLLKVINCLVIRGICDYSDSHQNKRWQPFAAASAAAWAKTFVQALSREGNAPRNSRSGALQDAIPRADFTLPYGRDEHFTGRADVVERVVGHVRSRADHHKRVALVGVGGVGKTQIAIEVAWKVRQDVRNVMVLWAHVTNAERFYNDYASIAEHFQLPGHDDPQKDPLELVRCWLSAPASGQWLLVLDNADQKGFGRDWVANLPKTRTFNLNEHIPRKVGCTVLITSRDKAAASYLVSDPSGHIEVNAMKPGEAAELFESHTSSRAFPDIHVRRLVDQLDGIPLAITQAAFYIIHRKQQDIATYLEMYQANTEALLSEDNYYDDLRRDPNVPNSVIKTWDITFKHIEREDPKAALMLAKSCFLDKNKIPESLLAGDSWSSKDLNSAIDTLDRFFMFAPGSGGQGFVNVHGLVQIATRVWLHNNGELPSLTIEVLKSMSHHYPDSYFDNWDTCKTLEPHAEALLQSLTSPMNQVERRSSSNSPTDNIELRQSAKHFANVKIERLKLLQKRIKYAIHQGWFHRAVDMAELCMQDCHNLVEECNIKHDSELILDTEALLLLSTRLVGDSHKVVRLGASLISRLRRRRGSEDPATLGARANVAMSYGELGNYNFAKNLMSNIVDICKIRLDSRDERLLMHMNDLATLYGKLQDWDSKQKLEDEILEQYSSIHPPDHPDVLTLRANHARTQLAKGLLKPAEICLSDVARTQELRLGQDHASTLSTKLSLSCVYRDQGRLSEAIDLLKQIQISAAGGDNDQESARLMNTLGVTLQESGRFEEAEELHRTALDRLSNVHDVHHPVTITCSRNYVQAMRRRAQRDRDIQLQLTTTVLMRDCVAGMLNRDQDHSTWETQAIFHMLDDWIAEDELASQQPGIHTQTISQPSSSSPCVSQSSGLATHTPSNNTAPFTRQTLAVRYEKLFGDDDDEDEAPVPDPFDVEATGQDSA